MNICPKNAITVSYDENSKTIPKIDEEKCIKCGLCKKVCPEINNIKGHRLLRCFAAVSKDETDRKECASGGIAFGLSNYVLKNGGVVFGAGFGKNAEVAHICADDYKKLETLKGSKYVQSSIGFSYREAKKKLDEGILVLFTGTPCQIAGLYAYLGGDREKLITIEIICHGVPPQKYLEEYLEEAGVNKEKTHISFRGIYDFVLTVYNKENVIYQKSCDTDLYFIAFLNSIIYRDNCYKCRYANDYNRAADITIGDFWELGKCGISEKYGGRISVVLTNTEKGLNFWNKNDFIFEERTVSEAVKGNDQLVHPPIKSSDVELFAENYKKYGFIRSIKKTSAYSIMKNNRRYLFRHKIKVLLMRIIGRKID